MKNIQTTVLVLLILCLCSCNKKSYLSDVKPAYLQEGSLFDHLKKDAELTQFVGLLKKTGYDSVLTRKDVFTVLAVKNGSFSAIDTNNIPELRKIMAMHILPSAVARAGINGKRVMAISGKYVKFLDSNGALTANNVSFTGNGDKAINGLLYKADNVIASLPSLFDVISTDPKFSIYFNYILSSYVSTFDPLNNTIVRYDSIGRPVYKLPWVLINTSDFLKNSKLNDESEESTLFIPTNDAIKIALGRLTKARGNNLQLVIAKLRNSHPDTTSGGYYFAQNIPYRGDSTILKDYIFANNIIKGSINGLVSGPNSFTNKVGNQYVVSSDQVQTAATASNGAYYVLNDITLPDLVYRKTYMFDPQKIDPIYPFLYSNGAKNTNTFTAAPLNALYDRFSTFDFGNLNGILEFIFPFVTSGNYSVVLRVDPSSNNASFVNTSYNGQPLKQNVDVSYVYALQNVSFNVVLGTINVSNTGQVKISFTCSNISPLSTNNYKMYMNTIRLIPVN